MGKFREVNEAAHGVRHRVISESGPSVDLDGRVVSDPRGLGRAMQGMQMLRELAEAGYIDGAQFRDMSQWVQQGGGSGIERNEFWQGLLGNEFDPFSDLGMPGQQRGLDAVRARNQRPGYDWRDEGRAGRDEASAGLGLGGWGLVSEGEPPPSLPSSDYYFPSNPDDLYGMRGSPGDLYAPPTHVGENRARQRELRPEQRLAGAEKAWRPAPLVSNDNPEYQIALRAFQENATGQGRAVESKFDAKMRWFSGDVVPPGDLVKGYVSDPLVEAGPKSAFVRFLLGRIGSPGSEWPPVASGGGPRVRPSDRHEGPATVPGIRLHRGALVGVERRNTTGRPVDNPLESSDVGSGWGGGRGP